MGTEERKQRYYRIINVAWNFVKNNLEKEMNEEFWESLTDQIKQEVNGSSNNDKELIKDMFNAIASEFNREAKNG